MNTKHRSARRWPRIFAAAAAGTVILSFVVVTGVTGAGSAPTVPVANPFGYKYGYKAALAELPKLYAGTSTQVNPTPRPAAKNKSIVIISSGQASISSSIPVNAAEQAAEDMGWKVTILDEKLMPSNAPSLVDQAIALKPDGIILDATDCDEARGPLLTAKADHIPVVGLYSYDCNDPTEDAGSPLFTANINFNNLPAKELGYFAESYGRGQADYIIAASHNKARVLVLNDLEVTVLKYTGAGFADQIAHSGGSQVVATLDFLAADLGPKLQAEIQAELLQHPNINWIKSPYTYATILGVVPALTAYPKGKYNVMGGEGFQPELQDIQQGTVTAAMAISSTWTGWASVDTLNSLLTHKPVEPSGIGWQLIDETHNMPANAEYEPKVNFEAEYLKAWGIKK